MTEEGECRGNEEGVKDELVFGQDASNMLAETLKWKLQRTVIVLNLNSEERSQDLRYTFSSPLPGGKNRT